MIARTRTVFGLLLLTLSLGMPSAKADVIYQVTGNCTLPVQPGTVLANCFGPMSGTLALTDDYVPGTPAAYQHFVSFAFTATFASTGVDDSFPEVSTWSYFFKPCFPPDSTGGLSPCVADPALGSASSNFFIGTLPQVSGAAAFTVSQGDGNASFGSFFDSRFRLSIEARAINGISGNGDNLIYARVGATSIPEPTSLLLVLSSGIALALVSSIARARDR